MQSAPDFFCDPGAGPRLLPPSLPTRTLWLEFETEEETRIHDLERQIGDARRGDTPADALIEQRQRIYDAWIERLDREIPRAPTPADRDRLQRQRERAVTQYKWT